MSQLKERYLTDEQGNRIGVILDIAAYQELIEAWEELESIQAYDAAKACEDEFIPLEDAIAEIENSRQKR